MKLMNIKVSVLAASIALAGCVGENTEDVFAKAKAYQAEKNHKASVVAFKKVVAKSPDNVEARELLAHSYIALGRYREAEKELQFILKKTQDDPQVLSVMSQVKFELKKYAEVYVITYKDFAGK